MDCGGSFSFWLHFVPFTLLKEVFVWSNERVSELHMAWTMTNFVFLLPFRVEKCLKNGCDKPKWLFGITMLLLIFINFFFRGGPGHSLFTIFL